MGLLRLKVGGQYVDVARGPAGPIGPQGPIGPAGPVAVSGNWTLVTSFAPSANSTVSPAYPLAVRLSADNTTVEFRGGFAPIASLAAGDTVFTLPAGFAPGATVYIPATTSVSSTVVTLYITTGGACVITSPISVYTRQYFLDGVSFSTTAP